jgi:DNA polymerase V
MTTKNTKKSGGFRQGAGRKQNSGKFKEPTKPIRVPLSILDEITSYLASFKKQEKDSLKITDIMPASPFPSFSEVPYYDCSVSAGFPSPADDSFSISMDLNKHLVKNTPATFFVRTSGDSMLGAGIHDGDLLVVDRSLKAKHHDIVIAAVNGDLTVKRLMQDNGRTVLKAENPEFSNIELSGDMTVSLWGVVTNVIHNLRS